MKRILITAAFFLLGAVNIYAQTPGPCDGTPVTTQTVSAGLPYRTEMCWKPIDANGSPFAVTQWGVTTDGVRAVVTMIPGTVASNNLKLIFTTVETKVLQAGVHTVIVDVVTTTGTATSAPLSVTAVTGAPQAPTNLRVTQ